jgi:adenine specific DNA methylase Mod
MAMLVKWGEGARDAYQDVMEANGDIALILAGLRKWLGDNAMMAYLSMMAVRLLHLRRILKPTGSLYLHCDPTASHYLRALLDAIFSPKNFQAEIIWRRTTARKSHTRFPRVHDTILHYAKDEEHVTFNPVKIPLDAAWLKSAYRHEDERGRYTLDNLTAAGTRNGPSGKPWRGYDPAKVGAGRHWRFHPDNLERIDAEGLIHWPESGGFPQYKQYLTPESGTSLGDLWTDTGVKLLGRSSVERLGYPTQKPVSLLERIIAASSNPGDVVLDPFCGCGTTIEAAESLKREWIGIDVTHYAVTLIENRLKSKHPNATYKVEGRPADLAGAVDLARRDKHQFQWWAAWRLGSQTYREEKRGADRGIDGNIFFRNGPYGTGRIIVSVKGGENIGVQMVRDLRGVIEREEAEMGVLVTLAQPTGPMRTEADGAGYVSKSAHGRLPRLQIVTAEELINEEYPKLPPLPPPPARTGFAARRRRDTAQIEMLLPIEGVEIKPAKGDFIDPRYDPRVLASG